MKRAIRTPDPEAPRCLQPIEKCVEVGFHQPPCRCFCDEGHDGACLSAATLELISR
jgi:hypothetical protein